MHVGDADVSGKEILPGIGLQIVKRLRIHADVFQLGRQVQAVDQTATA